jgi:hypothetical protein
MSTTRYVVAAVAPVPVSTATERCIERCNNGLLRCCRYLLLLLLLLQATSTARLLLRMAPGSPASARTATRPRLWWRA